MFPLKNNLCAIVATTMMATGSIAGSQQAGAATASYDQPSKLLTVPSVQLADGARSAYFKNVTLRLLSPSRPYQLELVSAERDLPVGGVRNTYDLATANVHLPQVVVNGAEYYAKMRLINQKPLRFQVDQLVSNRFAACPSFSTAGPTLRTCQLQGEITQDITLTSEITWLLNGSVFIGGDNANSATLTINPGTKIIGHTGTDFLWIRRGSKIIAEGTQSQPIIMTGAAEMAAGEWGGLVIAGNAPVNGCAQGVTPCELAFEVLATERYGGNQSADNSGVLKYVQIRYPGFELSTNQKLNGLTLLGVGSGTHLDFIQVHESLDDGVQIIGGTAQMKHIVLTNIGDDSFDWETGWTGKAQHILVKQAADGGDRGLEADNNYNDNEALPRSQPKMANMTMLGSAAASQGALLQNGTGANISNSVFTGFGEACVRFDHESTYAVAGTPSALTGTLTMTHTYLHCTTNFKDTDVRPWNVADWFNVQGGNVEGDPHLTGHLPINSSPLLIGGIAITDDPFFDSVSYIGAFENASKDWTAEWTMPGSL